MEELPMYGTPHDSSDAIQLAFEYATRQHNAGVPPRLLEQDLVRQGIPPDSAAVIIHRIYGAKLVLHQVAASRQMRKGELWLIGGLIVTAGTLVAAMLSPTGGFVIIAWGAIKYGFWQYRKDQHNSKWM